MKMFLMIAATAVLLAGCAAHVVQSNPRSVLVDAESQGVAAAQKLADAECTKQGRIAQLKNPPAFGSNQYLFDCVN